MGKTGSKITSSNRFEKLDPDIDCEASGIGMSLSNEDGSPPSVVAPSLPVPSTGSSSFLKGAEERRIGGGGTKERSARGGRSSNRKGLSSRQQQQMQGSSEAQTGGKVSSAHLADELGPEDGSSKDDFRGDGSRKKSSRHIKFVIPSDTDSSHPPDSSYFSTTSFSSSTLSFSSTELHKDDVSVAHDKSEAAGMVLSEEGSNIVGQEGPLTVEEAHEQQADNPKRIIYERVSCLY